MWAFEWSKNRYRGEYHHFLRALIRQNHLLIFIFGFIAQIRFNFNHLWIFLRKNKHELCIRKLSFALVTNLTMLFASCRLPFSLVPSRIRRIHGPIQTDKEQKIRWIFLKNFKFFYFISFLIFMNPMITFGSLRKSEYSLWFAHWIRSYIPLAAKAP